MLIPNKNRSLNVARRFLIKLTLFAFFAFAQKQAAIISVFLIIFCMSAAISIFFAIFTRSSLREAHLGYWDEAVAFGVLALLTDFILDQTV